MDYKLTELLTYFGQEKPYIWKIPTQWAAIHVLTRGKDAGNQQLALILA